MYSFSISARLRPVRAAGALVAGFEREVLGVDEVFSGQHRRPPDQDLELAHVPGPR